MDVDMSASCDGDMRLYTQRVEWKHLSDALCSCDVLFSGCVTFALSVEMLVWETSMGLESAAHRKNRLESVPV